MVGGSAIGCRPSFCDLGLTSRAGPSDGAAGGSQRQLEGEGGAVALLRLHGDLALVGLGNVPHDGQPEAGAAGGPAARTVDTVEALEDPLQVTGGDADAMVPHRDRHGEPFDLGCEVDLAAFFGVLDGVVEEV